MLNSNDLINKVKIYNKFFNIPIKENKTNNKICGNYYRCCVPCSCDIMKYSKVQKMKYKFNLYKLEI